MSTNKVLNYQLLNYRSTSALLLAVGMTTSAFAPLMMAPSAVAQSTFSDIQGSWAQACITELTRKGVISGYPDGMFRPNAPVTRAEFAALVGKAFPNAGRVRAASQFVDVSSNFWAYNAVSFASQTGFLSGYPGGVFNPAQNIPRAQVLVALASGLNYSPSRPIDTTLATFVDASAIPSYAQPGIAAATEKRLVVNYPNVQYLNPNQLASRAEVSAFLCQALTETRQLSAMIPAQYIAGATGSVPVAAQGTQVLTGTTIPVKFTAAERIIVAPNETADVALTVAEDIRNSQNVLVIPAGSQILGQVQPANGGSQFVARALLINGQQYNFNATSQVVKTTRSIKGPDFRQILAGAALGGGASALITGVTGDRQITAQNVFLGSSVGAAVAANRDRNVGNVIRDAAIGAAVSAGVAGITGDRTITPKEVLSGAAAAAAVGGALDQTRGTEVIVIEPNTDLTLTVNNNLML
jgi:hypothetical protein